MRSEGCLRRKAPLSTKTEKGPSFFVLTMVHKGEWVGWEKVRSLLHFQHSVFFVIDGNYRLASVFLIQ